MGLSFGVKLVPGVRVRVGTRGIRTSVGPRLGRVHVGGGRAGVSTGLGPVGLYGSLGGPRRAGRAAPRPHTGQGYVAQQDIFNATRAALVHQHHIDAYTTAQYWDSLTAAHHESFVVATRPVVGLPAPIEVEQLIPAYEAQLLERVRRFDRTSRRQAGEEAVRMATEYAAYVDEQRREETRARQARLDAEWNLLVANEPHAVFAVLADAFADNHAVAAPVAVDGDRLSVVMVGLPLSDLPERKAVQDRAGHWTTVPASSEDTANLYLQCLMSNVLATAMEAFAVAPGINHVVVGVVRNDVLRGRPDWNVYLVASFARAGFDTLARVRAAGFCRSESAERILQHVADEVVIRCSSNSVQLLALREVDAPGIDSLIELLGSWTDQSMA